LTVSLQQQKSNDELIQKKTKDYWRENK